MPSLVGWRPAFDRNLPPPSGTLRSVIPRKWVWSVGFLLLSADVVFAGTSIGIFHLRAYARSR
jgi:hypothetical protein